MTPLLQKEQNWVPVKLCTALFTSANS